jgi:S-adenosylmethionine synthetase
MEHYYTKVEKIEYSFAHVFDLFVPRFHTFTANGFVCHNSGKDPTKVDRSAAYMARYIAKNIVAADLADKCLIHIAYVIGRPEPLAIMVDTYGTGKLSESAFIKLIRENFDLTPQGMIRSLDLLRPIYLKTACYGHFGRTEPEFSWESTDKTTLLKREAKRL